MRVVYAECMNSTYNLNGCDHSAVSLLLNTCHVKGDPIITKPVYCLNRANFDKVRHFFVKSVGKLYFDGDDDNVDMIWNNVENIIKSSIDFLFLRKRFQNSNLCHG